MKEMFQRNEFQSQQVNKNGSSSHCTSSSMLSSSSKSSSFRSQSSLRSGETPLCKQTPRSPDLVLDLQFLESLLCAKCMEYCSDCLFINEMYQRFSGIAMKRKHLSRPFEHDELEEIADALKDLLYHSPIMPMTLVARVHSTIGIIHQMMGKNECAFNSFTKSLYLHTKTGNPDVFEVRSLINRISTLPKRKGDRNLATGMPTRTFEIDRLQGIDENDIFSFATKLQSDGLRSC
jgi:hypothetical protein